MSLRRKLALAFSAIPVAASACAPTVHAPKASALEHSAPDVKPSVEDLNSPELSPTSTIVTAGPSTTSLPANSIVRGVLPVDVSQTLACIRQFEGDYDTETGNGFSGAYQFLPGTWRHAVTLAGYPEWASWPASQAPAYVQDAAAWALYEEQGYSPWPPAMRWCR